MSDVSNAADIGGESLPLSVVTTDSESRAFSPMEAMRALQDARKKRDETPAAPTEAAPQESAPKADATPPPEATGETEETVPEDESPKQRSLPRSWTKEQSEHWAKLDPEIQDFLLEQDRKASAEVRRSQNEAAELKKGLSAKEQAVEQARTHYESALPALEQTLQQQIAGNFADIKTMADVENLAATDWPRYIQWDAAQKKLAAVSAEAQQAQKRQTEEYQQNLAKWTAEQDKAFIEKAPEMADPVKSAKVRDAAVKVLKDVGFSDAELGQLWAQGQLRDHRIQLLIRDATLYREAQAATKKPAPKPVPQVQRPGVARPQGAADADKLEQLSSRLTKTGNPKDAAALLMAMRRGNA